MAEPLVGGRGWGLSPPPILQALPLLGASGGPLVVAFWALSDDDDCSLKLNHISHGGCLTILQHAGYCCLGSLIYIKCISETIGKNHSVHQVTKINFSQNRD